MKNLCGKTVDKEHAYEVWRLGQPGGANTWTWYVLKKYQAPDKEATNPYARWFCLVVSPNTGPRGEMGDVYVSDIKKYAIRVDHNERIA